MGKKMKTKKNAKDPKDYQISGKFRVGDLVLVVRAPDQNRVIIGPLVDEQMEDLNESEEYDWIDTNPSNLSGQRLYDMMTELFTMNDSRSGLRNDIYWLENNRGNVEIWDSGGYYLEYNMEDFTVDRIRKDLATNINNLTLGPSVRSDYSNLAKALEPIIGPIDSESN